MSAWRRGDLTPQGHSCGSGFLTFLKKFLIQSHSPPPPPKKNPAELRGFLSVPFRVGCRTPSLFKDTELKALFRRIRATVNCFSVMKKQCAPEYHFHASALGPATSAVRTFVSRLEAEAMFEPHL